MDKGKLLAIFLVLVALYVYTQPNYVQQNGGFENKTVGWSVRHGYMLDTNIFHSGTASLRTDSTFYNPDIDPTKGDARAMWISKGVQVKEGQRVMASAFIKTMPANCKDGLRIGIDFKKQNGTILRANNGEFVPWGSDWTYRALNDRVRKGEEKITFWIQGKPFDCPASGWFDDITFQVGDI